MLSSLVFMAGATLARLLSGAVLLVFVARILGPQQFGQFALSLALAMVLALIVEFGHSTYIMRELGRQPEAVQTLLARTLRAKCLLMLCFALVAVLPLALGLVSSDDWLGYVCLCLMAVVMTLADFLNVCFRGVQRYEIETRNVVLASLIHVLLVVPAAWYFRSWPAIAGAFLISRSLYLTLSIVSFSAVFKGVGASLWSHGGTSDAVRQLRQSLAYAADASLVTVRTYADVFLISALLGAGPLGLYQVGMNLVRAVENLGPVIANVFLPKLSGLLAQPTEFGRRERQLMLLLLGCGLLCMTALFLSPSNLLEAAFGPSFAPAFELFPFFGLYLLARFVAMALGVLLTARGYQSGRALAGLISLGVLLLSGWALIPMFGVAGAAVGNIVAALVLVVWFALRLKRDSFELRDVLSATVTLGVIALTFYLLCLGGD